MNKTPEDLKEQARLFAESKMTDNWDRKDHIMIGVFYKHFVDYIFAQFTQQVEVRDMLTESEWLKLHSGYYGDEIDNVKKLVKINFSGEELYEYCQHMFEMFKQTIPSSTQWTESLVRELVYHINPVEINSNLDRVIDDFKNKNLCI